MQRPAERPPPPCHIISYRTSQHQALAAAGIYDPHLRRSAEQARCHPTARLNRKRFGFGTQIVTDECRLHLVSVLSGIPTLPAR
jgi:hypothetical protein